MKEKMKTNVHEWHELNLDDLAEFTFEAKQANPVTYNKERTIEREKRIIEWRKEQFSPSFLIVSRENNKIRGWLSADTSSPSILEIGRWFPIIFPSENEDETARSLITKCQEHGMIKNFPRVEVSFDIRDERDKQAYKVYKNWYESNDINEKEDIYYMVRNNVKKGISHSKLPEPFEKRNIREIETTVFYRCYYEAFLKGKDRMFLDQSELERHEYFHSYFDRSKPYVESASLAIMEEESRNLVGISLVRPRDEDAHVALLAIHPNYQGRGLGKELLKLIIEEIEKMEFRTISLGVDRENLVAMNLYQKEGFKPTSNIITHRWKTEEKR